ncbi:DgyrCDS13032 [Dimorphilus gyrociliatus]|uniref:DgyrCDS13032 n=1 Tax=Dimorphilus gyrociliatus TaxID=2664684 RepID=A0A7I8W9F8_9ANNE|nr:DgyrCDS13032 [Dimorphilus gyrociliatus]
MIKSIAILFCLISTYIAGCIVKRLNLNNEAIFPNDAFTAYQTRLPSDKPHYARLNRSIIGHQPDEPWKAWYGLNSSSYLQVNLGKVYEIHAMELRGGGIGSVQHYTSHFRISYGVILKRILSLNANNTEKIFNGNTHLNSDDILYFTFDEPILLKYFRFHTLSGNEMPVNLELYGCEIQYCKGNVVGLFNYSRVPNSAFYGYNKLYHFHRAQDARLQFKNDEEHSWFGFNESSYLQVDLGN